MFAIGGAALVAKCNEQLATQKTVKYYKTYDLSDDGAIYKVGGKSYSDNEDNVTINSYTSHGEKPNYVAEVITKRIPNKVRQENLINGDFIVKYAGKFFIDENY